MGPLKLAWNSALDWVYPPKCALCGYWDGSPICPTCTSSFERYEVDGYVLAENDALDARGCVYRYKERARQAVERLKFERVTCLSAPMSHEMARLAAVELGFGFDLVVPIPIHPSRCRLRGFNQSELLCEAFDAAKVDYRLLKRVRATRPQASLRPEERRSNLEGAFAVTRTLDGESILLVDDVVTSGATARECARALKLAGAEHVGVVAFCGGG